MCSLSNFAYSKRSSTMCILTRPSSDSEAATMYKLKGQSSNMQSLCSSWPVYNSKFALQTYAAQALVNRHTYGETQIYSKTLFSQKISYCCINLYSDLPCHLLLPPLVKCEDGQICNQPDTNQTPSRHQLDIVYQHMHLISTQLIHPAPPSCL